jgi:hypothetical protein
MANGTLKVSNIETSSGSGTITLGQSGETITIPSGATINMSSATQTGVGGANTPTWIAALGSNQTITANGTMTLVECSTVLKDSDSAYTNTSGNYKFTCPSGQAGTYYVFGSGAIYGGGDDTMKNFFLQLYKNGSMYGHFNNYYQTTTIRYAATSHAIIMDLAAGDTVQLYIGADSTGTTQIYNQTYSTFFGGYKLIGV